MADRQRRCPTPAKRKHPNERGAQRALEETRLRDPIRASTTEPRHCQCGGWHLVNTLAGLDQRIQEALR